MHFQLVQMGQLVQHCVHLWALNSANVAWLALQHPFTFVLLYTTMCVICIMSNSEPFTSYAAIGQQVELFLIRWPVDA